MSRYLIETDEEAAAFRREAESWLGTPFRPRAAVKGAAVDCVSFPRAVMQACGARLEGAYPAYSVDRSKHCTDSLILAWFAQHTDELVCVSSPDGPAGCVPRIGDVLVFQVNKAADHLGLLLNPKGGLVIHAVWPQGVTFGHLTDATWSEALHSIWRVVRP